MLSGGSGNYNDKEKRSGTYKIGMIILFILSTFYVYLIILLLYVLFHKGLKGDASISH